MSRVTEQHLHDMLIVLNERYPQREFAIQGQGRGTGVWMGKPGRWAVEAFNTNADTRDGIYALWAGIRLENERLLGRIAQELLNMVDLEREPMQQFEHLQKVLAEMLKLERYSGW